MPSKTLSTSLFLAFLALSLPFHPTVHAAKPANVVVSQDLSADAATSTDLASSTDSTGTTDSSSGSLDSSSWVASSSSVQSSASTAAAKAQWIQINTPMGKIASCSTIMLSWSSGGIDGPLEIDLVSATTGDMTTIDPSIDLSNGTTSYKWTVDAPADTYYLQGNAQDYPSLIYSGNFTISQGSSACIDKQASVSAVASASAVSATASASPSSGSTFVSGAERVIMSGSLVGSLAIFAALYL